jgi:WD40 repeat protein
MRSLLLIILIASNLLSAPVIKPSLSIKLSNSTVDMVFRKGNLYASLANGEVVSINTNGNVSKKSTLPKKQSSIGGLTTQKACSVDLSNDGKTIAIAGEDGSIYLQSSGRLTKSTFSSKAVIRKILFAADDTLVVALLSSEIVKFDITKNKVVATISIGTSSLSDMSISGDKNTMYVATEAGNVTVIDTKSLKIIGKYQGGNVDNIYKLDTQGQLTLTAGQDRRAILYNKNGKILHRWNGSFLIYAAGLSPSGKTAVLALDENNHITIVNTASGETEYIGKAHNATLNRVVFINENTFASCADENKIFIWRIK